MMNENLEPFLGAMMLCAAALWLVFNVVRWSIFW